MAAEDSAYGSIVIRGARENNLRNVSLDIPKRRITVFTGVSGSGKSSLVFGTIAAESQRLINETYPAFVQQFMPHYGQPDADLLENISAAIIVDQQRLGGNSRSTVATVTDTAQMLRVLFSRLGTPRLGAPGLYSYNDPRGMCPDCEGIGQVAAMNMAAVIDETKSLNAGALLPKDFAVESWWWEIYRNSGLFDMDKPVADYTEEERHNLLHLDDGRKVKVGKIGLTYEGVVAKLTKGLGAKDPDSLQPHVRLEYDRIFTRETCRACAGARLNAAALGSRVAGKNIAELSAMQVSDLAGFVRTIDAREVRPMVEALAARLDNLVTIGLGYLSLDRESATLSGGESQRVKMVRHLGSSLTDITYVFDEPSVGLHPHDVGRLAGIPERVGFVGEVRFGLVNQWRWGEKKLERMIDRKCALALPPGTDLPTDWPVPDFQVSTDEIGRWRQANGLGSGPAIALGPGSVGSSKRWSYYPEAAKLLVERGYDVWVIGGPGEKDLADEIIAAAGPKARDLTTNDLRNGVIGMAAAKVAVANDSGLMHIAAAVGTPTIGIFGPTSPHLWGPLNPLAATVQTKTIVPCQPCHTPVCTMNNHACMRDIPAIDVADVIQDVAARAQAAGAHA